MNNYKILPSILSAEHGKLIEETQTVDLPEIDFLHVDVMDGHFVPNITFGPSIVASLKKNTRYRLDVHLMIENVDQYIPAFARAGADILTIHQEACVHLHRSIGYIKDQGIQAGVTINPATPLKNIEWVLGDVDLVLIMSVNPGFGGQKFIPSMLKKVSELYRIREENSYEFIIEIDGGIDVNTAPRAIAAGAEYLVAGNAIFGQSNRKKAIQNMIEAIEKDLKKRKSVRI